VSSTSKFAYASGLADGLLMRMPIVVTWFGVSVVPVARAKPGGSIATPMSGTVAVGVAGASLTRVKLPVKVPGTVGSNVRSNVHDVAAASVAPHVWPTMLKGDVAAMLARFSVASPVLIKASVSDAEMVLESCTPKSSTDTENDTPGCGATAVTAFENELVLPEGSVEVAVTRSPGVGAFTAPLNVALHVPSVVAVKNPR